MGTTEEELVKAMELLDEAESILARLQRNSPADLKVELAEATLGVSNALRGVDKALNRL